MRNPLFVLIVCGRVANVFFWYSRFSRFVEYLKWYDQAHICQCRSWNRSLVVNELSLSYQTSFKWLHL